MENLISMTEKETIQPQKVLYPLSLPSLITIQEVQFANCSSVVLSQEQHTAVHKHLLHLFLLESRIFHTVQVRVNSYINISNVHFVWSCMFFILIKINSIFFNFLEYCTVGIFVLFDCR